MTITWNEIVEAEKQQPYFQALQDKVNQARLSGVSVYPPQESVYRALDLTPLNSVRVVILGQDPYHGPNQAHGLCFSVNEGVKVPPSLVNMYKELITDIDGFVRPEHGNLASWAKQGVLMLNTVLTVEQGKAHSHGKWGWEIFTDALIEAVNTHRQDVVFLLWGSHAQKKGANIDTQKHHVLCAPHPSPLSAHRGFFGCQHFSQTNTWLTTKGYEPINWQV